MKGAIRVSGLWKNRTKNGDPYLGGSLAGLRISVMPNTYKKKDRDPDFFLYLQPRKRRDEEATDKKEDGGDWL